LLKPNAVESPPAAFAWEPKAVDCPPVAVAVGPQALSSRAAALALVPDCFCRIWEALGGEIYVDANSNLAHSGGKLYRGDFGATLRAAPQHAIGAPKGQRIEVFGLQHLKPNP
jgi:hypothetical protein